MNKEVKNNIIIKFVIIAILIIINEKINLITVEIKINFWLFFKYLIILVPFLLYIFKVKFGLHIFRFFSYFIVIIMITGFFISARDYNLLSIKLKIEIISNLSYIITYLILALLLTFNKELKDYNK